MADQTLSITRRSLHGVAEIILAGPQHRRSGTIRLRARPGGFGTVADPDLAVDGGYLVAGATRIPLSGTTFDALAVAAGVDAGAPTDVYHTGSGVDPSEPVNVDPAAAAHLAECFARGDAALRRIAPAETPVLWPEHFDIGISLDEVNFGISPGDSWLDVPYAYIGPWRLRTGDFWTAPFGAALPMRQFADIAALAGFLHEGRDRAALDPIAGGA